MNEFASSVMRKYKVSLNESSAEKKQSTKKLY